MFETAAMFVTRSLLSPRTRLRLDGLVFDADLDSTIAPELDPNAVRRKFDMRPRLCVVAKQGIEGVRVDILVEDEVSPREVVSFALFDGVEYRVGQRPVLVRRIRLSCYVISRIYIGDSSHDSLSSNMLGIRLFVTAMQVSHSGVPVITDRFTPRIVIDDTDAI